MEAFCFKPLVVQVAPWLKDGLENRDYIPCEVTWQRRGEARGHLKTHEQCLGLSLGTGVFFKGLFVAAAVEQLPGPWQLL